MGIGDLFPGGKARPGRDADHSPLSSAEVVNEKELYLLSHQAPSWRVAGLLYFFFTLRSFMGLFIHIREERDPVSSYKSKQRYCESVCSDIILFEATVYWYMIWEVKCATL
jgi:hypothetical protein